MHYHNEQISSDLWRDKTSISDLEPFVKMWEGEVPCDQAG